MNKVTLMEEARKARLNAYAPYSHFMVGAALLCVDGTVVHGANVENASYGLPSCAERNAIFAAVSSGKRDFCAIAVIGNTLAVPCGACLQVMSEFAPTMPVYIAGLDQDDIIESSVQALLPSQFTLKKTSGVMSSEYQ